MPNVKICILLQNLKKSRPTLKVLLLFYKPSPFKVNWLIDIRQVERIWMCFISEKFEQISFRKYCRNISLSSPSLEVNFIKKFFFNFTLKFFDLNNNWIDHFLQYVCVCVCVWERERERQNPRSPKDFANKAF